MSELQRKLLRGQADVHAQHQEEGDTLAELGTRPSTSRQRLDNPAQDLSPIQADAYFDEALEVESDGDTFRVYLTAPRPERADDPADSQMGTLVVCHHGAGYSGLSFACLASEIRKATRGELGCLALDARGHGRTRLADRDSLSFTLADMAHDLVRVLGVMFPLRSAAPSLLLVGHSMGGPVVVEACAQLQKQVAPVIGCAVLDAVEGSALEAIQGMMALVAARPKSFDSIEDAIAWHLTSKTLNNPLSARVSVPALIHASADPGQGLVWRLNLSLTEAFWQSGQTLLHMIYHGNQIPSDWFTGLSAKFLSVRAAKLLVLAGTDRLDKPMMIGQMQGKYQLVVWPDVGHCLQEDAPARLAMTLVEFWQRNAVDTAEILKHVKKVGQR